MVAGKRELEDILAVKGVFQIIVLIAVLSGIAGVVEPVAALWAVLLLGSLQSVITLFMRSQ